MRTIHRGQVEANFNRGPDADDDLARRYMQMYGQGEAAAVKPDLVVGANFATARKVVAAFFQAMCFAKCP